MSSRIKSSIVQIHLNLFMNLINENSTKLDLVKDYYWDCWCCCLNVLSTPLDSNFFPLSLSLSLSLSWYLVWWWWWISVGDNIIIFLIFATNIHWNIVNISEVISIYFFYVYPSFVTQRVCIYYKQNKQKYTKKISNIDWLLLLLLLLLLLFNNKDNRHIRASQKKVWWSWLNIYNQKKKSTASVNSIVIHIHTTRVSITVTFIYPTFIIIIIILIHLIFETLSLLLFFVVLPIIIIIYYNH